MALIAFEDRESPVVSNANEGDLLDYAHRQKLAGEANAEILNFKNAATESKLVSMVKMMLWAQNQLVESKVDFPTISNLDSTAMEISSDTAQ